MNKMGLTAKRIEVIDEQPNRYSAAEEYSNWIEKFTKMVQQLDLIQLLEDMFFEIIKLGKYKEKLIHKS